MTRTILTTATALLGAMTLLTPAAEACISCDYIPEVARSHATSDHGTHFDSGTSHGYGATHYRVKRSYAKASEPRERPAKKRIVKSEPESKKVKVAKAADPAPVKTDAPEKAETENSSVTTATLQTNDTADANEAPETKEAPAAKKASKNVGCKKFFPTVGMTLTVPCE
jgi:hypothetical protein